MAYKIIEVHQVYQDGKILEVAVLWQSNKRGWVRASYCTTQPRSGYKFLMPNETISDELIQEIAGYGMNLPDEKKSIFFPGEREWEQ